MRPNNYPGRCESCRAAVGASEGFAFKSSAGWRVVCSSTACHRALGLAAETARRLNEDGSIEMPYDAAALPLLRAIPGARWNGDAKRWTVSLKLEDRPRVLEIADRLGLEVAASLRVITSNHRNFRKHPLTNVDKHNLGASSLNNQERQQSFEQSHDILTTGEIPSEGTFIGTPSSWVHSITSVDMPAKPSQPANNTLVCVENRDRPPSTRLVAPHNIHPRNGSLAVYQPGNVAKFTRRNGNNKRRRRDSTIRNRKASSQEDIFQRTSTRKSEL